LAPVSGSHGLRAGPELPMACKMIKDLRCLDTCPIPAPRERVGEPAFDLAIGRIVPGAVDSLQEACADARADAAMSPPQSPAEVATLPARTAG
jgi:hypothetical protein